MNRTITSLMIFCLLALPMLVSAAQMHPAEGSGGEPSIGYPFGTMFEEVRGDYRMSLGQKDSTVQERHAILSYFKNKVHGATNAMTYTSNFIIQAFNDADAEVIKNRTGQAMYYVGKHDNNSQIMSNIEKAIHQYGRFYNGNIEYVKEIILPEVRDKEDYYSFRSQPFYQYGSPQFSIQDMFMLTGDDLFFRIPYVSRLSGAGNPKLVESREPAFDPNKDDPLEYYSQPTQTWETEATHWPKIEGFTIQPNGDLEYWGYIQGVYDNKGKVDVIVDFKELKDQFPGGISDYSTYWKKLSFDYYATQLDAPESSHLKNNIISRDVPMTGEQVLSFRHVIPRAELEGLIDEKGTILTVYVTDNYGRYHYMDILYKYVPEDKGCLQFSRALDDHRLAISLPNGLNSASSTVQWGLTYNKRICAMDEVVSYDNDPNRGHVPEKEIYSKSLGSWDVTVKPTKDGKVEVFNTSKNESRPLVVQLKKGNYDNNPAFIETFTLSKGASKKLNISPVGDYFLYFPTPSEVSGFWDDKEFIMSKRKATKEFPDYIQPYVDEMLEQYGEPRK